MSPTRAVEKGSKMQLRLYVAGESPNSLAAIRNVQAILGRYPSLTVELKILDVVRNPELGLRENVLVTPMMIKLSPPPERRIFGNLKETEAVLSVLGLADVNRE